MAYKCGKIISVKIGKNKSVLTIIRKKVSKKGR